MRGLIYRELKIRQKSLILTTIGIVIAFIIDVILQLATLYGNLRPEIVGEAGGDIVKMFLFYGMIVILGIGCMFPLYDRVTAFSDYQSGFAKFSLTLPTPAWKFALAKVILMAIFYVIGFGLTVGVAAFHAAIHDFAFSETIFKGIVIGSLIFLLYSVVGMFLISFAKSQRGVNRINTLYNFILIAAFYGFSVLFTSRLVQKDFNQTSINAAKSLMQDYIKSALNIIDNVYKLAPLIAVAILGLGFVLTTWRMNRRGGKCAK